MLGTEVVDRGGNLLPQYFNPVFEVIAPIKAAAFH